MTITDTSHLTQQEIIDWCFDTIELPELDNDPRAAKVALTDVIVNFNNSFAAKKAEFELATGKRLPHDEFRRMRGEYEDWKRRATHIKTAVEERLRMTKAQLRGHVDSVPVEELVDKIRHVHAVLGTFLDEIDYGNFG